MSEAAPEKTPVRVKVRSVAETRKRFDTCAKWPVGQTFDGVYDHNRGLFVLQTNQGPLHLDEEDGDVQPPSRF